MFFCMFVFVISINVWWKFLKFYLSNICHISVSIIECFWNYSLQLLALKYIYLFMYLFILIMITISDWSLITWVLLVVSEQCLTNPDHYDHLDAVLLISNDFLHLFSHKFEMIMLYEWYFKMMLCYFWND